MTTVTVGGGKTQMSEGAEESMHLADLKAKTALSFTEFMKYDTYVFDCDGVIWGIDPEDTNTATATINYILREGKRVMFVTNNSNKSRRTFVADLEHRGISFAGHSDNEKLNMMVSAAFTTANFLREHKLKYPFVITSDVGLLEEFREAGVTEYLATVKDDGTPAPEFDNVMMRGGSPSIVEVFEQHDKCDCIVVGWDHGITARKVATAINFIKWQEELQGKELPIIACSGDSGGVLGTVEYKGRKLRQSAIGNGAMADFIVRSFDPPKDYLDMGKPSEALIEMMRCKTVYDVNPETALMVGDTLQTDIVFGNRAGMDTLLVLTGVTTEKELDKVLLADVPQRCPKYVLPKLGSYAEAGEVPGF